MLTTLCGQQINRYEAHRYVTFFILLLLHPAHRTSPHVGGLTFKYRPGDWPTYLRVPLFISVHPGKFLNRRPQIEHGLFFPHPCHWSS